MAGDLEKVLGDLSERYPMLNSGASAGPLVVFNPKGDTLVLSQMSEFMSTSSYHDFVDKSYNFGIMSGVNEIPEKYACDFVVYYSGEGVNKVNRIRFYQFKFDFNIYFCLLKGYGRLGKTATDFI